MGTLADLEAFRKPVLPPSCGMCYAGTCPCEPGGIVHLEDCTNPECVGCWGTRYCAGCIGGDGLLGYTHSYTGTCRLARR